MRLQLTAWLGAAAMAAVWAQAALPPTPDHRGRWTSASQMEHEGLRAALRAAGLSPAEPLSVAAVADGARRLRGRAARREGPAEGWPAPLYAEATPICDAGLDRAACWRLDLLELDGAAVTLRSPELSPRS